MHEKFNYFNLITGYNCAIPVYCKRVERDENINTTLTLLSVPSKLAKLFNLCVIALTARVTIVIISSPGTSSGGLFRFSCCSSCFCKGKINVRK